MAAPSCKMPKVKLCSDLPSVVVFSGVGLSFMCYVLGGSKSAGSKSTMMHSPGRPVHPSMGGWYLRSCTPQSTKVVPCFLSRLPSLRRNVYVLLKLLFSLSTSDFFLSSNQLPSIWTASTQFSLLILSFLLRVLHSSFCLAYLFSRSGVSKLWLISQIWPADHFVK